MKKFALAVAMLAFCATTTSASEIVQKPSRFGVKQTIDRLEKIVREKGFTIFARIDHAAGAAGIGQSLPENQVLIFGNPKVGTALMSSQGRMGLDLPIRVSVWEDSAGQVWLAYYAPRALAERHRVADRPGVVDKMTTALKRFTDSAVSAE